jgi:hypothetical protein
MFPVTVAPLFSHTASPGKIVPPIQAVVYVVVAADAHAQG